MQHRKIRQDTWFEKETVTQTTIQEWLIPKNRTPVEVNHTVDEIGKLTKAIRNSGSIPGILTIGFVQRTMYILDGVLRIEAFKRSGLRSVQASIALLPFNNETEILTWKADPKKPNNGLFTPTVSSTVQPHAEVTLHSAQKSDPTTDVILATREMLENWKTPPGQRPLVITKKVKAWVPKIQESGEVPGRLLVCILHGMKYIVNGHHRRWCALQTTRDEFVVTLDTETVTSEAELGRKAVGVNLPIAPPQKADDHLRHLEQSYPILQKIRRECPFIGYGKSGGNTVMSVNAAILSWITSGTDSATVMKTTVINVLDDISMEEISLMVHFFKTVYESWGKDSQYAKVWSKLNVTMMAWMWRNTVLSQAGPRVTRLTPEQFCTGAMALTSDPHYLPWLIGRQLSERDKGPCYNKVKAIMVKRLTEVLHKKVILPSPPFADSANYK